jgi:hypothetical protein
VVRCEVAVAQIIVEWVIYGRGENCGSVLEQIKVFSGGNNLCGGGCEKNVRWSRIVVQVGEI